MFQHCTWQVRSTITNDNLGCLPLVPGMRVMITDNAAITAKVVNGSQGILQDVKSEIDEQGHKCAVCAYVHILVSPLQAPGLDYEVVPILPVRSHFVYAAGESVVNNKKGRKVNKKRDQSLTFPDCNYPCCLHMRLRTTKFKGSL